MGFPPLQSGDGVQFTRTHHVVRKTTLYDMDVSPAGSTHRLPGPEYSVGIPFSGPRGSALRVSIFLFRTLYPLRPQNEDSGFT